MNSTDREEFAKRMTGMAEVYGSPLSDMALEIYFDAFKDFTYEQFCQGFSSVVKTHKYKNMPNPAEIIDAIEGGSEVKALTAWDEVLTDIRKRGRLQGGKFDNPAIEQAIRVCGGWEKICAGDEQDLQWVKKEFIEAYGAVNHTAYKTAIEAREIISALTQGIG
jgi:hypothetical protein